MAKLTKEEIEAQEAEQAAIAAAQAGNGEATEAAPEGEAVEKKAGGVAKKYTPEQCKAALQRYFDATGKIGGIGYMDWRKANALNAELPTHSTIQRILGYWPGSEIKNAAIVAAAKAAENAQPETPAEEVPAETPATE
jgi:hypothetical protein